MRTQRGPRTIFMWNMTHLSRICSPLARHLKSAHNVDSVLFTYGESLLPSGRLFGFDKADFREIVDLEPLLTLPAGEAAPPPGEIAERTADLERRTGLNLIDIMRTDRHLGIDFVTGSKFMRSRYGVAHDYARTMTLLLRMVASLEELVKRDRPIAVLSLPSSIGSAALVGLGERIGAPMRALVVSRYGKDFYWGGDWQSTPCGLAEAYARRLAARAAPDDDTPVVTAPPVRTQQVLREFHDHAQLLPLLVTIYRYLRMQAALFVRGTKKTYGNYLLGDWLSLVTERWRWRRRALRERPVLPDLPDGLPFVLYPLHVEPEVTLMVESQMCDNQLTVIDWLAKGVPPGWYVVVKEHPGATSPRPPGFWWRVHRYPNVIVAGTLENADDFGSRALAIACISGTVGVQAALAAKPVLTFHPNFIGRCMPHVLHADSYESTRAALRRIRDGDLPERAERMRAARAFVAALGDCSFPIDHRGLQLGIPDEAPIPEADVARAADMLMRSLDQPKPVVQAAR